MEKETTAQSPSRCSGVLPPSRMSSANNKSPLSVRALAAEREGETPGKLRNGLSALHPAVTRKAQHSTQDVMTSVSHRIIHESEIDQKRARFAVLHRISPFIQQAPSNGQLWTSGCKVPGRQECKPQSQEAPTVKPWENQQTPYLASRGVNQDVFLDDG